MIGNVYLIPIALSEEGYHTLPAYIAEKINACDVFFAENIRTARRAFKKIDKQFSIESYNHETMHVIQHSGSCDFACSVLAARMRI